MDETITVKERGDHGALPCPGSQGLVGAAVVERDPLSTLDLGVRAESGQRTFISCHYLLQECNTLIFESVQMFLGDACTKVLLFLCEYLRNKL